MTHSTEGRLRFGMFMAPLHTAIQNPTRALQRDLELIQLLDQLGFDEVWIGEHHSAGVEIVSSPEVFIAAAAERTRNIKLGTGVVSLPYHHPLWVADRAMLLDHLTQGRFMLGVGPGSLPTDAAMMGVEPDVLRPRLEEGLQAVLHLLSSREPLTMETEWFTLKDAVLQLAPYTRPRIELAVPGVASPTGARLAGKYGIGLLTIGAAAAQGIDTFALHWDVVEEQAAQHGQQTDRADWRVMSMVHLAETEEQARRDVEFGIADFFRYFQHVAAFPQFAVQGENVAEMIDFVNNNGVGVIGTPEMLGELVARVAEPVGRLRHADAAAPRVGEPRGHPPLARAALPRRHAGVPGARAGAAGREGPRLRPARGPGDQEPGSGGRDARPLRGRARRRRSPPRADRRHVVAQLRTSVLDPSRFRTVLGHFATGVTVITADDGGEPVGFACQSFQSLSLDPPLVSFAVARTSTTWPRIRRSGRFCANILAEGQGDVALAFAARGADKFAEVRWAPGPSGSPVLDGVVAFVDGEVVSEIDGGDHVLVLGRVVDLSTPRDIPPLLFFQGRFVTLATCS